MAGFNPQHSNRNLSEDCQPQPHLNMNERAKPSRRKMEHDAGGGKEKQCRRGMGVAQLERLRIGSAPPSSSLLGPYPRYDPASVSTGGGVSFRLAPRYGVFNGGSSPPPAPFLSPVDDFLFRKELPDHCTVCNHQKKMAIVGQNHLGFYSEFVGSNTPIFRKHDGSHFSNMQEGNELDAENGVKKGRLIEYYEFFPTSEKAPEMAAQESANQNGFMRMMKRAAPDPCFAFATSDVVGGGGGADASCVTTSTGGSGGSGGGAIGSVDASSSIDLTLRLSNY